MTKNNRTERRRKKSIAKKGVRKIGPARSATPSSEKPAAPFQRDLKLAMQHHEAGRLGDAESIYRRILQTDPDQPVALHLSGVIAHQLGKGEESVEPIKKAIAINPGYADAHHNLAMVYKEQGRPAEAEASYRDVLAINPDAADVHNKLGAVLQELGRLEDAVTSYREALALNPDYAEALNNLGNAFRSLGKPEEALKSYDKSLAIEPDSADTHNNLGIVLQGQGKHSGAAESYRRAIALEPGHAEAHCNLGAVLQDMGNLDDAVTRYRKSLDIRPVYPKAHSNLIFCMNYDDRYSQQDIFAESLRWEAAHATSGKTYEGRYGQDRDPERPLRIGYVSPDFRSHSVSHFLDPMIAGHDRSQFEVFCYAQVANPDIVTRRFQGLADAWCSTVGMTEQAIAERIHADEIDILVDLAGHTAQSRLLAFAARPAPVQIAWLGYPNTTGLSAMDYRLTDDVADPVGPGDALHSERLIRLPNGFLCFAPAVEAPAVAALPAQANGFVTFGSFNNLSKVTPNTVAAWARILKDVPRSRLLMKSRSLANEETRRRYAALFAERGVDRTRLEFHAWIDSRSGHLGAYDRIDIGLDPFPYNGTTTTCEALWMGVPVVSLLGDRHASRVGASILSRVGLAEFIADSVDGYVASATMLGNSLGRLATLRRELRDTMAASPLCNAAGFTFDIESVYRAVWRRWCDGA